MVGGRGGRLFFHEFEFEFDPIRPSQNSNLPFILPPEYSSRLDLPRDISGLQDEAVRNTE
jgi:hypothetical protein